MISASTLLISAFIFLGGLILLGIATEKNWLPARFHQHPIVYALSTGVIVSAWSFYGSIGIADAYGYHFLTFYAGTACIFLFSPLLLEPLMQLCKRYQLGSLADLLTFRFRSQSAGMITTCLLLFSVLPLLALQIRTTSQSVTILLEYTESPFLQSASSNTIFSLWITAAFCLICTLLTILSGARYISAQERHHGMVMAIAATTVVKILALLIMGLAAIYGVFDGFSGLDNWLNINPLVLEKLQSPTENDSGRLLLLVFITATIAMPHLFHMIIPENSGSKSLRLISWVTPVLLLLMSLPLLPILWAGKALALDLPPAFYILGLGKAIGSPALSLLVFLGGLAAAISTVVVIILAMASMCLNHLILPFYRPHIEQDIYPVLRWIRRLLVALISLLAYGFNIFIDNDSSLTALGFASYIACLQFLPAIFSVLYVPKANNAGLTTGVIAGFCVFSGIILLPVLHNLAHIPLPDTVIALTTHANLWEIAAVSSLAINIFLFGLISIMTRTSDDEQAAASVCSMDNLSLPERHILNIHTAREFKERLSSALGAYNASREVDKALQELHLSPNEQRPYALRRLRDCIEANLSGIMGASVAHELVNHLLPYSPSAQHNEDINLVESRLENFQVPLTGVAVELDGLRRYHRQTLENLPIGVCSLGRDNEILMWNRAMSQLTGIPGQAVIGSLLHNVAEPWLSVLKTFHQTPDSHQHNVRLDLKGQPCWVTLHKASSHDNSTQRGYKLQTYSGQHLPENQVILVEDCTDVQLLSQELRHSERLASIGRLAAGVAHEIGNPITGIACLAQNLHYDTDSSEAHETANLILDQTQRITRIVQTLVNFSHSGSHSSRKIIEQLSIYHCIEEAIQLLLLNKEAHAVNYKNHCHIDDIVAADEQQLLQVFINILSNARDASPAYSDVIIKSRTSNEEVIISITDQGSGISKEDMTQVFDPFYTTKEPSQGTGLGLSLVYSIIEEHNGHIHIESPVDTNNKTGSRVTVRLPIK